MTTTPPPGALHDHPCTDDDDLLWRWRVVLGDRPALSPRCDVWVLFFDADGWQLPVVVPVEGVPRPAVTEDAVALVRLLHKVLESSVPGGTAALALVRPGAACVGAEDRRWWRMVAAAARTRGVPLRRPVVGGTNGVIQPALDDLLGSAA